LEKVSEIINQKLTFDEPITPVKVELEDKVP